MIVKFQETVLNKIKQIPKGKVTTYGAIALELTGSVRAARAVGQAVAKNPYPITIPCHRVVRTDGDVGGYCFGVDKKIELLRAEGIEITGGQVLNFERVLFLFKKQKRENSPLLYLYRSCSCLILCCLIQHRYQGQPYGTFCRLWQLYRDWLVIIVE